MNPIVDNSKNAKLAIITSWVFFGWILILLISYYFDYNLLLDVKSGKIDDTDIIEINDKRVIIISIICIVFYFFCGIYFLRWLRIAYKNLHNIKVSDLSYNKNWSIWSWFVPILNFFRPYVILKEIWNITQQNTLRKTKFKQNYLLLIWWIIYVFLFIGELTTISLLLMVELNIDIEIYCSIYCIVANTIQAFSLLLIIRIIQQMIPIETVFRLSYGNYQNNENISQNFEETNNTQDNDK